MKNDTAEKRFLSDNVRYADIINGFVFNGKQIVSAKDLSERDTQAAGKSLYRDLCRKTAFGMNFAIVAIENQEEVHYLMPLRVMSYDAEEYKKQAAVIRKEVQKRSDVNSAEFLSGFTKENKLIPCVTIVIYYGDMWDGSMNLHGLLNFSGIPEEFQALVGDYHINILPVCALENTDMFQSDVKQVFDFIRFAKDKKKLKELVEKDPIYMNLDEDAYDMIALFSNEYVGKKKYNQGGKTNMCQAMQEMLADERKEGGIRMLVLDNLEEHVSRQKILQKLQKYFQLDEAEAESYFQKYAVM